MINGHHIGRHVCKLNKDRLFLFINNNLFKIVQRVKLQINQIQKPLIWSAIPNQSTEAEELELYYIITKLERKSI